MILISYAEFEPGRILIVRAEHDADLIEFITEIAKERDIESGFFTAMGALKRAELGFYDQETHKYQELTIDDHCEIASCVGNISILDGEPFVHVHAVLTYEDGEAIGGHLNEAQVFAAEVHIQEVKGPAMIRRHDDITDLSLWQFE